jgi:hypothetical protein
MPRVSINLMHGATADNDPFFGRIVQQFYTEATRRHPRALVVRQMSHGLALCQFPRTFDEYYMRIEGSARRNHKKAAREGCSVRLINYNEHLEQIGQIMQSTEVRQGRRVPDEYIRGEVPPCTDPLSKNPLHAYPYFGVFSGETLIGYAGCMVAGEYCGIQHILGHAKFLHLGPIPQLIIEMARHVPVNHPAVKYYAYGMYFGANESMRRFKRKFDFLPHRVDWVLGDSGGSSLSAP